LATPEEVATEYTNFQEDLDRVNLDLKINVLELDANNENVQNFMKNVKFEDHFIDVQAKKKRHQKHHHQKQQQDQQEKIHIELSPDGQEINDLTENNENVIEEKLKKKPAKKHHHHKKTKDVPKKEETVVTNTQTKDKTIISSKKKKRLK